MKKHDSICYYNSNGDRIVEIYLIRHTQVDIKSGICYGQTDVPLIDQTFKIQSLPENALVISSPLQRCLQLAKKLNHGNPVKTDERIMELNFGNWEMQNWNDIDKDLFQEWTNDYVNIAPPNGESYQALFERCQAFWNNLIANEAYETVIIVTHLGVIRALLALILEMPLKKSFCIQNDFGAINKLKFHHNQIIIEYLNG